MALIGALLIVLITFIVGILLRAVSIFINVGIYYVIGWVFKYLPVVPELLTNHLPFELVDFPIVFAVLGFTGAFFGKSFVQRVASTSKKITETLDERD